MTETLSSAQRLIRGDLAWASRSDAVFAKVRASRLSPAQAHGVRYESRTQKALTTLGKTFGIKVEHNPWFKFSDSNGTGACSPDSLLWLDPETILVIEIKYTWVPTAAPKYNGLYSPVIRKALNPDQIFGLILCKNLTSPAPKPVGQISACLASRLPSVYQWLGQGPLEW